MAINLIVLAVSLLMAGFFLVWVFFPRLRPWMEAPKYRVLDWDRPKIEEIEEVNHETHEIHEKESEK